MSPNTLRVRMRPLVDHLPTPSWPILPSVSKRSSSSPTLQYRSRQSLRLLSLACPSRSFRQPSSLIPLPPPRIGHPYPNSLTSTPSVSLVEHIHHFLLNPSTLHHTLFYVDRCLDMSNSLALNSDNHNSITSGDNTLCNRAPKAFPSAEGLGTLFTRSNPPSKSPAVCVRSNVRSRQSASQCLNLLSTSTCMEYNQSRL